MRRHTFQFLKSVWKKSPLNVQLKIKRKVRSLDSLINESRKIDPTLVTDVVRVDLLNEYRDLINSLIINFQEINHRIQKLEELDSHAQCASTKNNS
jgi:hypothetical protein